MNLAAQGDALLGLSKLGLVQNVSKLGLARQDYLQLLRRVRLEVRHQANLFEHGGREPVRLVDDEHGAEPARVARVQNVAELQK